MNREIPDSTPDTKSPVVPTPGPAEAPSGIGLGLSGGGYRAMLFHLGALWRLNELGYLPRLKRISSVSGGSITSAKLGEAWPRLAFKNNIAQAFEAEVVAPIRALASRTIDVGAVLVGAALPFVTIGDRIEAAYRKHLFGDTKVSDLPSTPGTPRFIINAANVQTGVLFRFRQDYVADWRIGINRKAPQTIPLAKAVAASSAFAPFLSPVVLDLDPADFEHVPNADLREPAFTDKIVLTDGGNYDNLGLQQIWPSCKTVLVSDASNQLLAEPSPGKDWFRHGIRAVELLLAQIISLRKRQLLDSFATERYGTYWGVASKQAKYQVVDPLEFDPILARAMAATPTRLEKLDDDHQQGLINWGYVICDTAMRCWVEKSAPCPSCLPYDRPR